MNEGTTDLPASRGPAAGMAADDPPFRWLVDSLPIGILIQGPQAEVLFCNPRAAELLGIPPDELIGLSSLEAGGLAIREDGAPFPGPDHPTPRALATGRSVRDVRLGWRRPDRGDVVWLRVDAEPEVGPDGQARGVVCTLTDVTAERAAEERLRESEARYRQLVEKAQDIIYRTDTRGFFTYVNPVACRVMGWPAEHLVGKHFLELIREDHRARVEARLRAQFKDRTDGTYDEFVTLTRAGQEVWIGQNVQLLTDGDRVLGFQAVARDITAQKRAEMAAVRKEPAEATSGAPAEEPPAGPRGRVLVVEDDGVNQKVVGAMLGILGYEVDGAGTGMEAVEACERTRYDAVLMDCELPGMDGFKATAFIRQRQGSAPRVPIIAVTAAAMAEDRAHCLAAGMDDYLAKPLHIQGLAAALRKWMGGPSVEPGAGPALPASHPLRVLEAQVGAAALVEIVDVFLQTVPRRLAEMRRAHERGDAAALRAQAHSLKGATAQIGARGMADLCGQVQGAVRGGELSSMPDLLRALEADYESVSAALVQERRRLEPNAGG